MRRRSRAKLLAVLVTLAGCSTEIQFENAIPGAAIRDVRWVSNATGRDYTIESESPLLAGEVSEPISIYERDQGASGRIHFELLADGKSVALATQEAFTADASESSIFTLRSDTPVTNTVVGPR